MKIDWKNLLQQVNTVKLRHNDFLKNILETVGVTRSYFYYCVQKNQIWPKTAKKLAMVWFDMDIINIKNKMS